MMSTRWKKVLVIGAGLLLLTGSLEAGGFRVGLKGGLNHQTFDAGITSGSGLGLHWGLSLETYLTPSILPIQLGIEAELLNQNAQYNFETLYKNFFSAKKLNNLVIPFLVKLRINIPMIFDLETGLGPSLSRNLSGQLRWESMTGSVWIDIEDIEGENLETDLGFQFKGEVGIKVIPLLRITPGFSYQKNLTANDPNTDNTEKESGGFFYCGLYLSL